jgi:DnaK suppressor protein
MDVEEARKVLLAERTEVLALLSGTESSAWQDREAEGETGDWADSAQPLTAQGVDDAVAVSLTARIGAIDRALERIDAGSYGLSVRSGKPIPDARLRADPAAELTVEEASQAGN